MTPWRCNHQNSGWKETASQTTQFSQQLTLQWEEKKRDEETYRLRETRETCQPNYSIRTLFGS